MSRLLEPLTIGGVTLKNRIVFAPTSLGAGSGAWYERLARGGCGMVVMADLSVVPSMLGAPGLDSMRDADVFRETLKHCHRYGCKVSAQLFHPEYDVRRMHEIYLQHGRENPQEVRRALQQSTENFCDTVSEQGIREILDAFEAAASRAALLGFDMIQLHGDRLAGSFTSPLFNHRTDAYGECPAFPIEMVKAVRRGAPKLPLDYKLTIRMEEPEYGRGGIAMEQIPEFVRLLEQHGVDSFHVTLANHTVTKDTIPGRDHPYFQEEGCFADLARAVKGCTDRPVCCVGKIQTPAVAEALLAEGMDLIGMSRQLLADPEWPRKAETGRTADIRACLYCNRDCLGALMTKRPVGCVLHKEDQNV